MIIGLLVMAACATEQIASFEECVEAGNPVKESYPRQCTADGKTFVEKIDEPVSAALTECESRSDICTREYRPVCALKTNDVRCVTQPCPSFDAVTLSNACTACSDDLVMGYHLGTCEKNTFVICEELQTGFDIEKMAHENGWICVDTCPGNYDAYTTQIGSRMCIQHYGEKDIAEWDTCERSTASCDCVKAYETTDGETIDDASFRCVPKQYAERLLFRGGQERLDGEGKASTMIA